MRRDEKFIFIDKEIVLKADGWNYRLERCADTDLDFADWVLGQVSGSEWLAIADEIRASADARDDIREGEAAVGGSVCRVAWVDWWAGEVGEIGELGTENPRAVNENNSVAVGGLEQFAWAAQRPQTLRASLGVEWWSGFCWVLICGRDWELYDLRDYHLMY